MLWYSFVCHSTTSSSLWSRVPFYLIHAHCCSPSFAFGLVFHLAVNHPRRFSHLNVLAMTIKGGRQVSVQSLFLITFHIIIIIVIFHLPAAAAVTTAAPLLWHYSQLIFYTTRDGKWIYVMYIIWMLNNACRHRVLVRVRKRAFLFGKIWNFILIERFFLQSYY